MAVQKKIKNNEAHQFAFYVNDLANIVVKKNQLIVDNKDLVHRLVRVVKLSVDQTFILFDQQQHIIVQIIASTKKEVFLDVVEQGLNIALQPSISYLLPLLKKDALQQAIYSLAEIGVNNIQLIATEKSRQNITEKELQRLQKTVIVAAEQSKQYAFPIIHATQKLQSCLKDLPKKSDKILFDIQGDSFFNIRKAISHKNIYLLVGPEGGLTQDEAALVEKEFVNCLLTPTVLRAVQAVAVSAALFRLK